MGDNLDFLAVEDPYPWQYPLLASGQSPEQGKDLPPVLQFQTVQIEPLVIDRRIVGDGHATPVVPPIADGDLDRLDGNRRTLTANFGPKGTGLSTHL